MKGRTRGRDGGQSISEELTASFCAVYTKRSLLLPNEIDVTALDRQV